MPKYGIISGLYFTHIRTVSLHIQSGCGKIRTRNNSVFGHFSSSVIWPKNEDIHHVCWQEFLSSLNWKNQNNVVNLYMVFSFCIYEYWTLARIPFNITKQVFLQVYYIGVMVAHLNFLENCLRIVSRLIVAN